jgi:hypothetical protein
VVFVTEDDTQSGLDHVDGYRSVFLAIGPWVKHEYVSKTHTSLASIFKTVIRTSLRVSGQKTGRNQGLVNPDPGVAICPGCERWSNQ